MAALLIESKNPENLKILASLAKKLGDNAKTISTDEMEDMLFGEIIQKTKTGKKVSRDSIMKILGVK